MICGQCGHANPPHAPVCERCSATLSPAAGSGWGSDSPQGPGGRRTAPGYNDGAEPVLPPTAAHPQMPSVPGPGSVPPPAGEPGWSRPPPASSPAPPLGSASTPPPSAREHTGRQHTGPLPSQSPAPAAYGAPPSAHSSPPSAHSTPPPAHSTPPPAHSTPPPPGAFGPPPGANGFASSGPPGPPGPPGPRPSSRPPPAAPSGAGRSEPPPSFSQPPPSSANERPRRKGSAGLLLGILAFFLLAGAGAAAAAYFLWWLPAQESEDAVADAEQAVDELQARADDAAERAAAEAVAPEPQEPEPEPPSEPPAEEPVEEPPAQEPVEEPPAEEPTEEPPVEEPTEEPPAQEPPDRQPPRPWQTRPRSVNTWEARARRAVRTAARQCFMQHAAHGMVAVQVTVAHDGRISTSRVVNDGTGNLGVARCISGALVGRRIGTTGPRSGSTVTISFSG